MLVPYTAQDMGQDTTSSDSSWINDQLIRILTTMGTQDGQGMTRIQSVAYLQWVLKELELVDSEFYMGVEYVEAIGMRRPVPTPSKSRFDYDAWISWAVDLICDWPQNLFQGVSGDDGGGTKLDEPSMQESPELRGRLCRAALQLKATIPGLRIALRKSDPECGWALVLDKLWHEGPPTQSSHDNLTDPWFMPFYKRSEVPNEDEKFLAAPDRLLSRSEYEALHARIALSWRRYEGGGWSI
ncbi:hypothetical protein JX265_005266 [Neoarthrinium moseri]|uniref:Uncharacterized protein n=1 Tax=Neoarthrinium moseri TaxID=1658444 RepID=A0A9P9WPU2_9PEZI|nr:uncharacterized protein JN550_007716 [Neoarthrinium moseri]KAI1845405.1 hypothetical protein JX266_008500 [Neoarthrinium moseri]KAI1866328.1 hypothetical protein JN550_007716 [Neoarthrinium moseri]KAI1873644.1 hypothetical protein JX265_005266 [Neoarthrinium moseri]